MYTDNSTKNIYKKIENAKKYCDKNNGVYPEMYMYS